MGLKLDAMRVASFNHEGETGNSDSLLLESLWVLFKVTAMGVKGGKLSIFMNAILQLSIPVGQHLA
jgi:hypothetical protein